MKDKDMWRKHIGTAWNEFAAPSADHLSQEMLIDYYHGRLEGTKQQTVESHLAQCAECLQMLVDLSEFLQSVGKTDETIGEETPGQNFEAFWQRVQPAMPTAPGALDQTRVGFWKNSQTMFALAAGLLLAFAFTAIWAVSLWLENQRLAQHQPAQGEPTDQLEELKEENLTLQEQLATIEQQQETLQQQTRRLQEHIGQTEQQYETQLAQLRQPEVNVPVEDIYPLGDMQRSKGDRVVNRIGVPSGTRSFMLILWDYKPGYQEYSFEITDPSGEVIWRGGGLRPNEAGNLTLRLNRSSLSHKEYALKLYGRGALVAEYVLLIQ